MNENYTILLCKVFSEFFFLYVDQKKNKTTSNEMSAAFFPQIIINPRRILNVKYPLRFLWKISFGVSVNKVLHIDFAHHLLNYVRHSKDEFFVEIYLRKNELNTLNRWK